MNNVENISIILYIAEFIYTISRGDMLNKWLYLKNMLRAKLRNEDMFEYDDEGVKIIVYLK